MSLAGKYPIAAFAAGIALLIIGLNTDNRALWIVGIVLLILGLARRFRRT
jgi:hypothetical protein